MPPDDARFASAKPDLTVADQRVLDRVFQHPLSHNLSWRDVIALFSAAGGVEHAHNGRLVLRLGADHLTFAQAHDKDLDADDVMALRHFLSGAGWTPMSMPAPSFSAGVPAIAIIIDHASARIYDLPPDDAHHAARHTHQRHHTIDPMQHDADRAETYPVDHRFFDAIAQDVQGDARIVVISHGKGQSNEGDHLVAYLEKHHRSVHDRIARVISADLPHRSVPEILVLARDALDPASENIAGGGAD